MSRRQPSDHQFALDLEDDVPASATSAGEPDLSGLLASWQETEALLRRWQAARWIRPLDVAFARLIRELCAELDDATPQPGLLLMLAALTSHQVGRGHVCIDLATLLADAGEVLSIPPEEPVRAALSEAEALQLGRLRPEKVLAWVGMSDCLEALSHSPAVSDGTRPSPLVLDGSRLYLRRFWGYEQRIVAGIRQRLQQVSALADPQSTAAVTLSRALGHLFPPTDSVNHQKMACALAARHRFAVITGGPGTGKTTTVVSLLAALQAVAGENPARAGRKFRIRLAAPTGKAAARLNESIGGAVSRLPLAQLPGVVEPEDIPTRVTTLHRLLGSRPGTRRFRHHADNPLLLDVLVIDEASMVDVDLMASVFEALPAGAQLILLGDRDQLASVDAGAVLGELCQRAEAGHYTPATARWLGALTGETLPQALLDEAGEPLDQAVAMLRKSYRFDADSGIGRLAAGINRGNPDRQLLQQARQGRLVDVAWLAPEADPGGERTWLTRHALGGSPERFLNRGKGRSVAGETLPAPVGYTHYLSLLQAHGLDSNSSREQWDQLAREVLAAFAEFQVLCALRQGPWGVEGLNQQIAAALQRRQLIPRTEGWYAGRPVLITGNDYNLGLMNGDVGIAIDTARGPDGSSGAVADGSGQGLRVAFPADDGSGAIRWIAPGRLQQLETVYAMTVHKSQGSEFGHCCLVLPERMSPVLTRELVYTGITRARHWLSLVTADDAVLAEAVSRRVTRVSGLAARAALPQG